MNGQSPPPQALVFWIIWFAILAGFVMIQVFAGGGIPTGKELEPAPLWMKVIPVVMGTAALAVRFFVLPRIKALPARLPPMIIGLALAEAAGIVGAFLIDGRHGATRLTVFLLAVVCIILQAPVYTLGGKPDDHYQR